LDLSAEQALELGQHRPQHILPAEVRDDALLDLAIFAVGFDDADVLVDGAVAGADLDRSGIHERAMASSAKRIRHVRPRSAPSITSLFRGFKVNSRRKLGRSRYKLSLRLAEPSGARTLKNRQWLAACWP